MKKIRFQKGNLKKIFFALGLSAFITTCTNAQTLKLTLDLREPGANVSPMLYGLMTEEINHSYDGGLYAELIRNRIFKDNPTKPDGWSLVQEDSNISKATMKIIAATPRKTGTHQ